MWVRALSTRTWQGTQRCTDRHKSFSKHDHTCNKQQFISIEKNQFGSMNYIPLLPHRIVYPPEKVWWNFRNIHVFESPPFSIVREVLTLASWVERSTFLETSLKTSWESKSLFPNVKNAKSNATIVAKQRNRVLILRWKRIVRQRYVDSERCIQRGRFDWADGSTPVTSGFEERKMSSTQCLRLRTVWHFVS